jgi:hypothetical protein
MERIHGFVSEAGKKLVPFDRLTASAARLVFIWFPDDARRHHLIF